MQPRLELDEKPDTVIKPSNQIRPEKRPANGFATSCRQSYIITH